MATPKTIPSRINKTGYVKATNGTIYITSVLKTTSLRINSTSIPETIEPQEFYSPIKCSEFQADPYSVTYIIRGTGADVWSPVSSSDLRGWYDASDLTTITEASSLVSSMADKSSQGQDVSQSTEANKPSTNQESQNGLNMITSDGGDQFIDGSFSLNTNGNLAIFGVFEIDEINNGNDSLWSFDGVVDFQFNAANAVQFDGQINAVGTGGADISLSGGPFTGPSIFANVFDFTGDSTYTAWVDGLNRTSTAGGYTTELSSSQSFKIFANRSGVQSMKGSFGEIIIIDDVSSTTRQKIEGYLAHKWGLLSNLSSSHPYKSSVPTI